jgi:hypothetical protein
MSINLIPIFSGFKMVGIHRKIVQLAKLLQKYSPTIDQIVPGLGTLVGSVVGIGENIADGINSVYNDYNRAKRKGKKYNFLDGVDSFLKPVVTPAPTGTLSPQASSSRSAVKALTKSYGGLHPRLKLESEETFEKPE